MARFVLVLLLVILGALVIALVFDHRGRRDERIDRLRWAFLHGTPLAGHSRPAATAEVVHPAGMRFRAPASWAIEMMENGSAIVAGAPNGDRRIAVEVLILENTARSGQDVVAALKGVARQGEHAIDALPNGHVLMKTVAPVGGLLASYEWRLGRAVPPGGVQIAVFRLRLAIDRAAEVIAQSDLATLDRAVREATFDDGGSRETAAL
jgi:hypothetical protein